MQNTSTWIASPAREAQSPIELFRKEFLQQRRAFGSSTAWKAEMWQEIRAEFERLPESERARFRDMAELTRSVAAENRRRSRLLQCEP